MVLPFYCLIVMWPDLSGAIPLAGNAIGPIPGSTKPCSRLSGATSPDQVQQNASAVDWELGENDREQLRQL